MSRLNPRTRPSTLLFCLPFLVGWPAQAQMAPPQKAPQAEAMSRQVGASHLFVFQADKVLKSASLVGSFNSWNKAASPMRADADGLTWRLALPLRYGRYVYKFALMGPDNKENWVVDPHAPLDASDKVNDNSLLIVAPAGYDIPASPDDGQTATDALLHANGPRDLNYEESRITLSLRARPGDLRGVVVRSSGHRYPMRLLRADDLFAYYTASLPWNRQRDLTYFFELADGKRVHRFGTLATSPKYLQPFRIAARGFQPYLLSDAPQPLKMNGPLTTRTVAGPSWAKNQPIYEVNLDAYGFARGTALHEFEKHLPVLKEMGIGLIWFMPLHPRGQKKAFGSPYSVRDYLDISPDLGTKAEFRALVERAHALGLRVLMDWVPNHTSWDNPMIEAHPEFYAKNDKGEIVQASTWSDVAQLNYGKPGAWNWPLWNQMRDHMSFWVREFGIDGFRCDVAGRGGKVPVEFWNWLRPQLNAIKPIFMLAEADDAYLHPAFDMTYSWGLPPILWDICAGRKPATAIDDELRAEASRLPEGAIAMRFLDNHDWHPHADWGWGQGPAIDTAGGLPQVAPLMLLCATLPGKPLLYNGQEMSFLKANPPAQAQARTASPVWSFYRALLALHQSQPAIFEGSFSRLSSDHDDKIYAFSRQHGRDRVLVIVNLSGQPQAATLRDASVLGVPGRYREWFSKSEVTLSASPRLDLAPWDYRVYVARAR